MGRILLWPLLLLGAALIYLQVVGVPGGWAAGFLVEFEERGLFMDAEHITLDVLRGMVAHGCRVYDEPARRAPILEAEEIALRLDPRAWFKGEPGIRGVTIKGGALRLGAGSPRQRGETLRLDRLQGGLVLGPHGFTVNNLSAHGLGLDLRGGGQIDMRAALRPEDRADNGDLLGLSRALESHPEWLTSVMDQLKEVSFAVPPKVEIDFILRPGIESGSLINVEVESGHTVIRGLEFDDWSFRGSLKGARMECDRAIARAGQERIEASGSYHLDRRTIEAHFDSTLSPTYLEGLIPIGWRDRLDQTGLFFSGPVRVEVALGPALPERLIESFSGRLRVHQAELHDVWIERADLRFQLHEDRLVLPGFDAVIGKGKGKGAARGQIEVDLGTKAYRGQLHAEFDWAELLPVLTPGLSRLMRSLQFGDYPPVFDAKFSGLPGRPEEFKMDGTLRCEAFSYQGTYANTFRSDLIMNHRVLTLADVHAVRDEGTIEGSVIVDLKERRVDLDLHTTVEPLASARTGGPVVSRIVSAFRFEGPTETTILGSVHLGTHGVTDLTARIHGEKMGFKWFLADEATFELSLKGRETLVTNLVLTAYGGEGDGVVRVTPDEGRWRYAADLRVNGMSYSEMMKQAMQREGDPRPGKLKLDTRLTGFVGDDFLHTMTGQGFVEITEARLLEVPLFGGLSRGLSRIFPRMGFSTQTDFRASYRIEDQRVHTEDAELEGAMLGLTADGSYGLEKKDLQFKVEVRPFREGAASSVVHVITSPLSKLLQFNLRGTFDEPRWRPDNLPKEMFLIFE